MSERLKRAVIKEELIVLTGDVKKAVLLNQLIYWSERVKDFDKFIQEENKRLKEEGSEGIDYQHGWIYKTAEELSDETMLGMSDSTVRRHIKPLIENGWLDERQNPKYKYDQTKQYRVNIRKIQKDLQALGYALEGYKINIPNVQNEDCNFQNENWSFQNENAIPEITYRDYISIIINNNIVELSLDTIQKQAKELDKKSTLYELSEENKEMIKHSFPKPKEKYKTDKVSLSAPAVVLLHTLLEDSKKRNKWGLKTKSMAKSLAKAMITYIKVFERLPDEEELTLMDELLSQKEYTPSVVCRGFRVAKKEKTTDLFKKGSFIMQCIDEVRELDKINKLNHAMDINEKKREHIKNNKKETKKKESFRQFSEFDEF